MGRIPEEQSSEMDRSIFSTAYKHVVNLDGRVLGTEGRIEGRTGAHI
jgi:hypothetical protein